MIRQVSGVKSRQYVSKLKQSHINFIFISEKNFHVCEIERMCTQPQNTRLTNRQSIKDFSIPGFKTGRLIAFLGDGLLVTAVGNGKMDTPMDTHSESNSSI